ncbi:MAG: hypothetical protein KME28_05840, partial [Pelatocladus maniniholoensis HA4357-MV3]|nr:hypothetical protein [Pelatocladus maniniholoensis HA4357-MV3]
LIAWFLEDSPLCDLVRYSYFGVKKLLLTFFYHKIYYFGDVYYHNSSLNGMILTVLPGELRRY